MLVSATDIARWAIQRDAQGKLPQVIRRLIQATVPRILKIGFRSGEGVQLKGWDGILDVDDGNAFVPDGVSAWELGTGQDVKGKANEDYQKRTVDALGLTPSESTFVFVTARRWKNKDEWAEERKIDGPWRDVRVLDADDLEAWLETALAVHIWLSVLLGKQPPGAIDPESYWQDWANATDPAISPELLLAGRKETVKHIHHWIDTPSVPLALRAETRMEATAVFVASVRQLDETKCSSVFSRLVVVRNSEAWNQLVVPGKPLILIKEFDSPEVVGRALQHRHGVVTPLGRADGNSPGVVDLPRLATKEAAAALSAMGMPNGKVAEMAALARRSLTTLRRRIGVDPALMQPTWARPEHGRSLIPALLAGRWSDAHEGDREAIGTLAQRRYEDARDKFVRWTNEEDPPIRCVGSVWYLGSMEDAWALLARYLTRDDLEAFEALTIRVLGASDPALELPSGDRWAAGVLGKRAAHSEHLRTGIANTLAIMGSRGESINAPSGLSLPDVASSCVRQLLASDDWKVWASLPLSLIAEAAPEEFLAACDRGRRGEQPFLRSFFQEETDSGVFGSFSPHTHLLFALERTGWCSDYLARSSLILAALAKMDPGGRLSNRPQASLEALFLPWCPQTSASLERRLRVLDLLREKAPDIAWKTMLRALPKSRDFGPPISTPEWREWAPEDGVHVSPAEYANALREVISRVLSDVGSDGNRWTEVIANLSHFPPQEYADTVRALEALDRYKLGSSDSDGIWQALRTLISKHRSYEDSDWALPQDCVNELEKLLERFRPHDPIPRFGWLFDYRPILPERREEDLYAQMEAVYAKQDEAVRSLCQEAGLEWVSKFREKVNQPMLLGASLARVDADDQWDEELLADSLDPDDPCRLRLVEGYVRQKNHDRGDKWARDRLQCSNWTPSQQAAFCLALPCVPETWDILETLAEDTLHEYWQRVRPVYIDVEFTERVVRRLLDHKRPSIALEVLIPSYEPPSSERCIGWSRASWPLEAGLPCGSEAIGRFLEVGRRRNARAGTKKGRAPPLCRLSTRFLRRLRPPPDVQGHEFEHHRSRHGRAAADAKTTAAVSAFVFRVRRLDPTTKTVAVLEFLRPLALTTRRSRARRR